MALALVWVAHTPASLERRRRNAGQQRRHRRSEEALEIMERRQMLQDRRRWREMPREDKERLEPWRLRKSSTRFEDRYPDWRSYRLPGLEASLKKASQLDSYAYASLMRKCGRERCLEDAKLVHRHIQEHSPGLLQASFIGNLIVQMYGRCRSPTDARQAFEEMTHRNVFSWSIMLESLVQNGLYSEALEVYERMQQQDVTPDGFIFSGLLTACTKLCQLETGTVVHHRANQLGLVATDVVLCTSLIHFYSKCGNLEAAVRLFQSMEVRDSVSTTAMIGGYVRCGKGEQALDLYWGLRSQGLEPDAHTYAAVLGACSNPSLLLEGRHIHKHVVESLDHQSNVSIKNALITMYSRCGSLADAELLFRGMDVKDAVTWNAMIAAYAQHGQSNQALLLFQRMGTLGIPADVFTFTSVLAAFTGSEMLGDGRNVHHQIAARGLLDKDRRMLSCIIGMYSRCESINDARKAFDDGGGVESQLDVDIWNAMLSGYAQLDMGKEVLYLYRQMLGIGVPPDRFTFSTVIDVCAGIGAFREGGVIHSCSISLGVESDAVLGTALVNLYGKCGCIEEARAVFQRIQARDKVSWSAMLAANAQNGYGTETLQLSFEMNQEGVQQSAFAASSILHGCSHGGLLFEGVDYFLSSCRQDFGVELSVEVCVGFVDLLGRAGWLKEAEHVVRTMPYEDNFVGWVTLLSACKLHGNAKLGKVVAKQLMGMQAENTGPYMLLNNIYAASGMWEDVAKLRRYMRRRGVKGQTGCSSIEVRNKVHEFTVGDSFHPRNEEIRQEVQRLHELMKTDYGYKPDTSEVFHDVTEAEKEEMLMYHSEKMAMAFGVISTRPGTELRIVKNLRVCSDCHTVGKLISKATGREIVVRDGTRFHHFKHGLCSCKDYW